ncbi:MAG: 2-phospho-L-lactate guanylyltransferase, partial [Halioglobus sp.]|nr:2-phospho-L-lactate guanylyltransferase [Halioglobus sp.]
MLPLKDLVQAKTRLAGLLRPSERRALAQAMAEDVLSVLAGHPSVERIVILSDDPAAGLLAGKYRAECWSERALGCAGLNPVLQSASQKLLDEGATRMIALHADLPLLCAADVTAVEAALDAGFGPVVGPDRHATGTNLLAFDVADVPVFSFGEDSFQRHMAAAHAVRARPRRIDRPGIAQDVDDAADLAVLLPLLRSRARGHTAGLLCAP